MYRTPEDVHTLRTRRSLFAAAAACTGWVATTCVSLVTDFRALLCTTLWFLK